MNPSGRGVKTDNIPYRYWRDCRAITHGVRNQKKKKKQTKKKKNSMIRATTTITERKIGRDIIGKKTTGSSDPGGGRERKADTAGGAIRLAMRGKRKYTRITKLGSQRKPYTRHGGGGIK